MEIKKFNDETLFICSYKFIYFIGSRMLTTLKRNKHKCSKEEVTTLTKKKKELFRTNNTLKKFIDKLGVYVKQLIYLGLDLSLKPLKNLLLLRIIHNICPPLDISGSKYLFHFINNNKNKNQR